MASSIQAPAIFTDENVSPSKPSVLRSMLPPRGHKRNQSDGSVLTGHHSARPHPQSAALFLPPDHPHARRQRPLAEMDAPNTPRGTQKKQDSNSGAGLHKKTKSSVSLKSLLRDKDKKETMDRSSPEGDDNGNKKPKKTKSSTSLSALFKRSQRGRKDDTARKEKDKENTRPLSTVDTDASPIWAQFTSQPQDHPRKHYVPENERSVYDEMSLYTPKGYSPSKQRNFHDHSRPTLTKRTDHKPRPMSEYISSSRFASNDAYGPETGRLTRRSSISPKGAPTEQKRRVSNGKRESRVMAVINAFNSKDNAAKASNNNAENKDIDGAFEELLDSRNIPHNMRDKMRSLDLSIKADFVKKHHVDGGHTSSNPSFQSGANTPNHCRKPLPTEQRTDFEPKESKSRRSRTFTISKGESSPKKQKHGSASSHKRPKSVDFSRPGSSRGLPPSGSMTGLAPQVQPDNTADPSDFVHYLREVQKPEIVEVGKLHKLRILLRNETVAWVDSFISHGGMDEVIGLLYRIIKVEWREEHEDALLHETLLCLKALCTTSLALRHLSAVEPVLFPTLLGMLFDKEKKGPSEFTTRGIVINLLFTHLSSATPEELPSRARTILSYLRDQSPPEEAQPVSFIANIYQPRPYRVWCKELSDVTKEVFWIFLHHFNVVPLSRKHAEMAADADNSSTYVKQFFPALRPPVPAAPYVGGVEWDATNYFANHLDLMNGLLASLPTAEDRKALRDELKASGFEKVMGCSLRTCKEKFYPAVHDALSLWITAAKEDGWDYKFVREGPPRDGSAHGSPIKAGSPKKNVEPPPKLDFPTNLDGYSDNKTNGDDIGGWL